jgi:glucose-6-phosphate isomerase
MIDADLRNLSSDRVGPATGLELEPEIAALAPLLDADAQAIRDRRDDEAAMLGWIDLPHDPAGVVEEIDAYAAEAKGRFDDLVLLGIGGSALGASAVVSALQHPARALQGTEGEGLRLHVVDNVDADVVHGLLTTLDPRRTLVNVVSKSGTTAETMAAFLAFDAWLRDALGDDARDHVVATTDPAQGILRPLVDREGIRAFSVPPSVGGRFSVLSPVGLLPIALAGIDLTALLAGAARANDAAARPFAESAPKQGALAQLLTSRRGATINVLMPYSTRLRRVSDWYVQLWAESLGKRVDRRGARVHAGTTPLPAVGTTDQHSQVQLFNEGPPDKVVCFVRVGAPDHDVTIPEPPGGLEKLGYLGGRRFHELMNAEQAATAHALAAHGRPSYTLRMPRIDPEHVGELLQGLMWQTALVGERWGIDAYDQPGVELGKVYTYALMGREGFDEERRELEEAGVEA